MTCSLERLACVVVMQQHCLVLHQLCCMKLLRHCGARCAGRNFQLDAAVVCHLHAEVLLCYCVVAYKVLMCTKLFWWFSCYIFQCFAEAHYAGISHKAV